ncbi:hypothetical protein PIB30_029042 [Stylosanthes scabra]|uniref:Uncharacterized protein n=1 Tax=Stylosanthes scabra TaxID=79078 RepID=A0ABU6QBR1_9FABA|nr:hypothetical protein [Stylosanthes scabra]
MHVIGRRESVNVEVRGEWVAEREYSYREPAPTGEMKSSEEARKKEAGEMNQNRGEMKSSEEARKKESGEMNQNRGEMRSSEEARKKEAGEMNQNRGESPLEKAARKKKEERNRRGSGCEISSRLMKEGSWW